MYAKPVMEVDSPRFASVAEAQAWADGVYRYLVSLDRWAAGLRDEVNGKVAKSAFAAFSFANRTDDRSMDCDATSVAEIADVLGTLCLDASGG